MTIASKSKEELKRVELERLGRFVMNYFKPPHSDDLGARSSIREDAVIRELVRLLADHKGKIRVIDTCCGFGGLARRILLAMETEVQRIDYVAVDRDSACIDRMILSGDDFKSFGSFKPLLRDVCDLGGVGLADAHLVILNNVLHEIPPRIFPQMFVSLNALLCPNDGRICLIDMESLPADFPEANAISWTTSEIVEILIASGFKPEASTHDKSVRVYQIHCRRIAKINEAAMRAAIRIKLRQKLDVGIKMLQKIEASPALGADNILNLFMITVTIARLTVELSAFS
jgi:hypothetical protein